MYDEIKLRDKNLNVAIRRRVINVTVR